MSHSRETVTANPGPPAAGPYSHAVKSGAHLFVSGQVHLDPDTGQLIDGTSTTVRAQVSILVAGERILDVQAGFVRP